MRYGQLKNIKELRRFLGMLNLYYRFLLDTTKQQVVLINYLKHSNKNDKTSIIWTNEAIQAFSYYKNDLSKSATLAHSYIDLTLALLMDTSNYSIGTVLQQKEGNNDLRVVSCFSKKLSNSH